MYSFQFSKNILFLFICRSYYQQGVLFSRPILDLSSLNLSLKAEKFKMETPETIRTSLWVTSIDFRDAYFHIPIHNQSRKYLRFHVQGQTYQFKALPFGLSTAPLEFTVVTKEVKLMALQQGIRIHQYQDDWLVRANSYQLCLHHTKVLVVLCQKLGWIVNMEKSELEPKQVFDFVGYQFDLLEGKVRPTLDRRQALTAKIKELLSGPTCPVRKIMSLIGLLTATEKQVHLDRLHMRPIQWHLKNNWRVPESMEKVIPIPKSLHPHLRWWLEKSNVLRGQPLHPVKHALQLFTDASKEGWGAHLNEHTARRDWSLPESKLHINLLELKAIFLALKRFQKLCQNNVVLIARQHYSGDICKQGRRHEIRTSMCPSLEDYDLVYQKSGHPQSSPHPRSPECGSREAPQVGPNHSNRMVSPPTNFSSNLQQVAPTPDRSVCNKVQQQTNPVCITSAESSGLGNRCAQHVLGESGPICPYTFMLGKTKMLDTNLTGRRYPCTHLPVFFQRINWPKRARTVWLQWLYQPWLQP